MLSLLLLGEISGRVGIRAIETAAPTWRRANPRPLVIANAGGLLGTAGLTRDVVTGLADAGIDVLTVTPRAAATPRARALLADGHGMVRPLNAPAGFPGCGTRLLETAQGRLQFAVVHTWSDFDGLDDPFAALARWSQNLAGNDAILLEIQGQDVREKIGLARWFRRTRTAPVHWFGTGLGIVAGGRELTPTGIELIDVGRCGAQAGVLGEDLDSWLARTRDRRHAGPVETPNDVRLDGVRLALDRQGSPLEVAPWAFIPPSKAVAS